MILFKTAGEMTGWAQQQRSAGKQIGFVPTMGALHEGHISLIDLSRKTAPFTVCSIFVNPTQFNDPGDFRKYPVTIEKDILLLERAGVQALFLPEVEEMYPGGTKDLEKYPLGPLETIWEGKFRPGHFQGVCQVVSRLLDIVGPDHLFMGQKDYQQCLVIRRLLDIKGVNVILHTCPIVREADGLAMSSRNQRLTASQRDKAPAIFRALSWIKAHWPDGSPEQLAAHAGNMLEKDGLRVDYVAIADASGLEPLQEIGTTRGGVQEIGGEGEDAPAGGEAGAPTGGATSGATGVVQAGGPAGGNAVALVAAFLGEVRLIDNMILTL
jgi:pantoate--beta-alanine ligase